MDYEQIRVEKRGAVSLITHNRPERLNAWTWRMNQEQVHAIQAANDDPEVGAIVMTGGGRAFCAGADIRDTFQKDLQSQDAGKERQANPKVLDWVELVRSSKPLVAAVNGVAVGVGLTMIAPFDVIVASDRAQFGMFFIKVGLVPELASTYFLAQRMGFGHASEMCLSGRLYSAEEAGRCGLAQHVVEHDRLLDEALGTAELMAANPGPQLRWIKRLITENATDGDYKRAMRREGTAFAMAQQSPEHREAVAAFVEKRKPDFVSLARAQKA
jgi:2-(1,2-epoxy-1,2-dihydrophenyl)acetyl-CoA isomerase